jgi:chromosome segregation ATPase
MKNSQQNLLIVLALSLCALCAHQWYGQTLQRNEMEQMNRLIYQKSEAIQGYTNTMQMMDRQIAQMDGRITELKNTVLTNGQVMLEQKREINRLEAGNTALMNQIAEYKKAVETVEAKLKEAYEGVKKQNESIKELVAERDDLVTKLNDSVKERNGIVTQYNDLVERVKKMQGGGKSQ